MPRKPGGCPKPTEEQRQLSMIPKDKFDRWFQQFWNLSGASTKEHSAPFPLELAFRLVQTFSFVGDTVLDPFCGTGSTMVAALKTRRNSIGLEFDTEYCRMAASRLMNENTSLFSHADLKIQLHPPAIAIPQDALAIALHDSAPDYRTKPAKRTSRPARKAEFLDGRTYEFERQGDTVAIATPDWGQQPHHSPRQPCRGFFFGRMASEWRAPPFKAAPRRSGRLLCGSAGLLVRTGHPRVVRVSADSNDLRMNGAAV